MRAELDKKLSEKYPNMFDLRTNDNPDGKFWGFEHADGWFDIIDELCDNIHLVTETFKTKPVVAMQVKEKFGTLSFYVGSVDEKIAYIIHAMIDNAQSRTSSTCEICGKHGFIRSNKAWIRTLCKDHAIELNYTLKDYERDDGQGD
jgi:hypothetical protein